MLIGTAAAYLFGGAFMQFTSSVIPAEGISLAGDAKFGRYQLLFILSGLFRFLVLCFAFRTYEEKGSRSLKEILHDFRAEIIMLAKKAG